MRRILTFVTTLAFVALFAMPAQAQEKSTVRFGIQGGITSSTISGDDVPDEGISSKTGFWAGGKFNYFFAQNWSVALEANWLSGLGAKFASGSFESETKISYFAFPLTINFAFPLGDEEKTWIGLSSGFTTMLRLTCDVTDSDVGSTSEDCKDDTESTGFAVPFAAMIGFKASDAAVVYLGARYQLGLSEVAKDLDWKLNWWEFTLGVGFPTG